MEPKMTPICEHILSHSRHVVSSHGASKLTDYTHILRAVIERGRSGEASELLDQLQRLKSLRRASGWEGHEQLSMRLIKRLISSAQKNDDSFNRETIEHLVTYLAIQCRLNGGGGMSATYVEQLSRELNHAYLALCERVYAPFAYRLLGAKSLAGRVLATGTNHTFYNVGAVTTTVASALQKDKPSGRFGRFVNAISWVLEHFFSYEALRHTSLETSWGLRTYVPGTFGLAGNVGPWIMLNSGALAHYQSQSVPMRINPGATFSTPFWVATYNRPGFGAGASLPFASTYLDKARYKLLFGIDGVGYVRIGEWLGRGPYFTVSGSLPIWPTVSVTWNASVFSPGFAPLVKHSTPIAEKVRAWTGVMKGKFQALLPW